MTEIYLKQRKELKDGDNFIEVNEVRYQIWIDPSKRPLTSIEKVMLRWLKDERNSTAQQVATWASVNFAHVLEQEEERRIREIKERRGLTEVDTPAVFVCPIIRNESRRGFYLGRFVPWVSTLTLNAEDYKQIISNLIPEAWKQHNFRRAAMSFVLNKWQRSKYDDDNYDDDVIKNISDLLRMSLWLAEHRIQIMTLCICIGSLIWVGIIGLKKGKYFYVSTSENTIKPSLVRIYKPKSVIRKPKVTGVAQKPKTTKISNMTKEGSKKQRENYRK